MKKKDIKNELKLVLPKPRYKHTIGVSYTAQCLAMRYEVDLEKAFLAGLLHDCGRVLPDNEKINECNAHNIPISDVELNNPGLLHAKLGVYYAKSKYEIDDQEILDSIMYHTTGRPNMSILEKIIYVADYIEPLRDKAPNLDKIRKIAFEDIDKAVYLISKDTVDYVKSNNLPLDPLTQETMNYYNI